MRLKRQLIVLQLVIATTLATVGFSADDFSRWEDSIKQFEHWDTQNAWPRNPVLFVGSSSIRMWPSRESFPDLPVINRGFGGSQIADVNHFADRIVLPYKPRLIVFYAGDNDIAAGKTPERVLEDYKKFVSLVKSELPRTRIIYITIKPSSSRWEKWPQMKQANEMIEALSKEDERLYYCDAATILLKTDGKPDDSLFLKDKLHLNAEGYKRWTTVLQPIIDEALQAQGNRRGRGTR